MMQDAATIQKFATAGKARVTITSKTTGKSFTLKFTKAGGTQDLFFVSLLTGADNERNYSYMGLTGSNVTEPLRRTAKSALSCDAPGFRAAEYFIRKVLREGAVPEALEVRHEGACGRCNRTLTTPESIDRGIGPECWGKMGE